MDKEHIKSINEKIKDIIQFLATSESGYRIICVLNGLDEVLYNEEKDIVLKLLQLRNHFRK